MPNEPRKKARAFLGDPVAEASATQRAFLGVAQIGAGLQTAGGRQNMGSPIARFREVHTWPDGWMNPIVEDVTERGE